MARQLRIEYEGAFYHVIQRGIERKNIFNSDTDYQKILLYLSLAHRSYSIKVHTYCLMPNHYHFIIETPHANLSKAMHAINTSYSVYYNRKHRRVGPVYQGTYKSYIIDKDEYLHHVSRYIHLNPVRAHIVERPEDYKWSSYRAYVKGARSDMEGFENRFILSMFGNRTKEARKLYKEFVEDKEDMKGRIIKENIIKGIVIGSMDFFKEIKHKYIDHREDKEIPLIREAKKIDNNIIEQKVNELAKTMSKKEREVRKMMIYLTRRYTQYGIKEIGKRYAIGYSAVSQICRRIDKRRSENENYDEIMKKVEREMSNVKT